MNIAADNLAKIKANLPNHVAIIMDGNGRWAKTRGKIRSDIAMRYLL